MKRKIVQIDQERCNGCNACVSACHEGAIQLINGKAQLIRDDYCDGLGDCLPACPMDAITIIEREALAYDEQAVLENMKKRQQPTLSGCQLFSKPQKQATVSQPTTSCLKQWPVQLKLVNINAAYFDGADVLIAADCSAYAMADFHQQFMKDKVTIIACPKLDQCDYSIKLYEIFRAHNIRSITIVRMEVPCCKGLAIAVTKAIQQTNKMIPLRIVTLSNQGLILNDE